MKLRADLAGVCVFASFVAAAADWPQWRGSDRNGFSAERVNVKWGESGPPILWRASVGTGFSSIAVSAGKIYTMGNTNNTDAVVCLNATTGTQVWRHEYPSRLDPQYYEGGPGATPTVHEGKVYTINKWGTVLCLDAMKGSVLWRHDLWGEGIRSNRWGFAGSPLVYRNMLLLNAGEAGTALELPTGKVVWNNGTNVAGYASPTLIKQGAREALLLFASEFLVAVDPSTGRELWRHPFKTSYDTNNTDPIARGNTAFISSFSRGSALLELGEAAPKVIYTNKNLFNHLSPGILLGDHLYAFNGEAKTRTDLRCLHFDSGEVKWSVKDPDFGSMICAGGVLLILGDKGELLAGKPSPEKLEILARAKVLDGLCWTPPALTDGLLYARNAKGALVCVDLR